MREAKQRGDAEIDKIFKSDKARDDFFFASESRNLYETAAVLKREHKLEVSINTISRWLAKIRTQKADARFYQLISEIRDDRERAEQLGKEIGNAQKLSAANIMIIQQMLFRARQTGNPKQMMAAAQMLSMVLTAVAKEKASEASVISAETQRSRFQFDAAKAALAAAGQLQEISKSKGSEKEKVDRAIVAVFGTKPKNA
jgi:hypothetical protein